MDAMEEEVFVDELKGILEDILTDINLNSSDSGYRTVPGMTPAQRNKFIATLLACLKATYDFEPGLVYCNLTISILCWPPTKAGEVAELQCFEHAYTDTRFNARRFCDENGTWTRPDFSHCIKKDLKVDNGHVKYDTTQVIFLVGYSITSVTLVVAIGILLYFKSLRCLRNLIHCNLMIAMLISCIMWLILITSTEKIEVSVIGCKLPVVIATYFSTTVYFWMFVEGLYLFIIVMWAYDAHKSRLYHYFMVGWGVPLVLIIIWASLLAKYKPNDRYCWLPLDTSWSIHTIIFFATYIVLGVNMMIVVVVVWVLVKKLRMLPSLEIQQVKKSMKAICVLLPLLGSHYLITWAAEHVSAHTKEVFKIIRNILQAFQGVLVATFFCFLNSDVLAVIRQRINAAQESRSIQRYVTASLHSKSGTSIQAHSSPSLNAIDINKKPKIFEDSVDESVTRLDHSRHRESSVRDVQL